MFHFVLFSLESCWQSAPYHVFLTSMQRFRNRVNIEFGVYLDDSHGKESACIARDLGLIPGSRRSPGEDKGYSFQYSCLENPMERGTWWVTVQGVTRVRHSLMTKPPKRAS